LKDNVFKEITIFIIKNIYQKYISPELHKKGVNCRFYPSCSNYAIEAIHKYGAIKGLLKSIDRIKRCRPDYYDSCIDIP